MMEISIILPSREMEPLYHAEVVESYHQLEYVRLLVGNFVRVLFRTLRTEFYVRALDIVISEHG